MPVAPARTSGLTRAIARTHEANVSGNEAADQGLVAGLPESYSWWRSSRLGRITDGLEERLILDLLGSVDGLDVLDLGCGYGVLASTLSRRGARVTGLDADPRMLAAARRRAKAEAVEVNLVQGRVEAPPFPDGSFDCVVAVTVLCFVHEADRAIAELARVIRPGAGWSSASSADGASGPPSGASVVGSAPRRRRRRASARAESFDPSWKGMASPSRKRAARFSIRPLALRRSFWRASIPGLAGERPSARR
jgi:SAM-dependent methyltransferase